MYMHRAAEIQSWGLKIWSNKESMHWFEKTGKAIFEAKYLQECGKKSLEMVYRSATILFNTLVKISLRFKILG